MNENSRFGVIKTPGLIHLFAGPFALVLRSHLDYENLQIFLTPAIYYEKVREENFTTIGLNLVWFFNSIALEILFENL